MLWMDTQHTKHVTYQLAYHFVWCPKYRKKILVGKLALFVEQEIRQSCEERQWAIGTLNIQPDYAHLFLSAPPSVAPSENSQAKGELVTWHHNTFSGEPLLSFSTTRHFGKDFWLIDEWYFADMYGEDGRNPEELQ